MTSDIAASLGTLCASSGEHVHAPKQYRADMEATHILRHQPGHFFEDGADDDGLPPLSESEKKEFDAVGSHIDSLKKMHPHLRRLLYNRMHHINVKEGNIVILQGELSDSWYILIQGSLQCIVAKSLDADAAIAKTRAGSACEDLSKQIESNLQFSTSHAEQKQKETVKQTLALTLAEAKTKSDAEQIGHSVHYKYGHGVDVSGIVVGIFHPGDDFGESCFHFGSALVESRIKGHHVNRHRRASIVAGSADTDSSSEETYQPKPAKANKSARASTLSQMVQNSGISDEDEEQNIHLLAASDAAKVSAELKQKRRASTGSMNPNKPQTLAKLRADIAVSDAIGEKNSAHVSLESSLRRHPLDHEEHFSAPPPPLPKQTRRAASVVALEDSQLLKVTLRDYTICLHQHRKWMLNNIIDFLRPLDQFSDLNDYTLEQLAGHCNFRTLGRHQVLMRCGDQLSCYVLKSGTLRVLVRNPTGGGKGFMELARLGVGNTFGGARLAQGCSRAGEGVALVTGNSSVVNQVLEIPPGAFFKYVIAQDVDRRNKWATSLQRSLPVLEKLFKLEERRGGAGHNQFHREHIPVPTRSLLNTSGREVHWKELKNALSKHIKFRAQQRRLEENIPKMFHHRIPRASASPVRKVNDTGVIIQASRQTKNAAAKTVIDRPSSSLSRLLKRGVQIQSRKGAALYKFSKDLEDRGRMAAKKFTTLSKSQVTGLKQALGMDPKDIPEDAFSADQSVNAKFDEKVPSQQMPSQKNGSRKMWWEANYETPLTSSETSGIKLSSQITSSNSYGPGLMTPRPPDKLNIVPRAQLRRGAAIERTRLMKRLVSSEANTNRKLRSRSGRVRSGSRLAEQKTSPPRKQRWLATRRLYEDEATDAFIGRRRVVSGRWHVFQDSQ